MTRKNNNSLNVNIGTRGSLITALPAVGDVVTAANLPAGAIVLVDNGMKRLDSTSVLNASRVKVVHGLGATKPLVISHDFNVKDSKVTFKKYVESLEQITAVGYNPVTSTGSLPSAASTTYYVELDKMDNDFMHRSNYSAIQFDTTTGTTGSQADVATGLVENTIKNTSHFAETNGYVTAFAVVNTPGGALGTGNIEKGSKVISNAAALITALPSGTDSLLSIAVTKTIAGTATTFNKVYAIDSFDATANTITLTTPMDEATATGVTFNDGAGTNYGVIYEGTVNEFDTLKMRNFAKNRFSLSFNDSSTSVTEIQAATEGTGNGPQAMWDEFIGMGIEGQKEIYHAPSITRDSTAKIDGAYGVLNITSTEDIHALLNVDRGRGNIIIYIELDNSGASAIIDGADSTGEFVTVLFAGNDTRRSDGTVAVIADLNE